MKIGIHVVQNDGQGTGMTTYTRGLVNELLRFGENAEFVLFAHEDAIDLWQREAGHEVQTVAVPHPGLRPGSKKALARRMLYDVGFDPLSRALNRSYQDLDIDVIHYTGDRLTPLTVQVPAVVSFFSANYWMLPGVRMWPTRTRHQLSFQHMKISLRRAAAIVAPSTYVRNALVQFGDVPPDKVFVSRPAGWTETIRDEPSVSLDELDVPDRFILYPSNSWPYKNHARLFAAMRQVNSRCDRDLGLVLTGTEDRALLDQARQAGIGDRIRLLGLVTRAQLATLYRRSVATVHPSLYEAGGSFSMAEAMYCGSPVVCSGLGSMVELAGGAARYFDPYDSSDMAQAICAVVGNEQLRAALALRGSDRTTTFSNKEAVQNLMAAYRHAAETGSPSP